jgi:hypothetical protein
MRFDTNTAMASTMRSFSLNYPTWDGEILPDSIRFCVAAEAWDCPGCTGPGGIKCKPWSTGDGESCAPVSLTACSDVLEVP